MLPTELFGLSLLNCVGFSSCITDEYGLRLLFGVPERRLTGTKAAPRSGISLPVLVALFYLRPLATLAHGSRNELAVTRDVVEPLI